MKYLLIYRHATAMPQGQVQPDHDRTLSDRGQQEAARQWRLLKDSRYFPDYALCSSAVRTQQTLRTTLQATDSTITCRTSQALYLASPGDIFREINEVNEHVQNLMVVGHNPSMHQLCLLLAGKHVENDEKLSRISFAYPPATISIFEIESTNWKNINPASKALLREVLLA